MKVITKFAPKDSVIIIHDRDQIERMIVTVQINGNGAIRYCVMQGINESWHYDFELMHVNEQSKRKAGFIITNENHQEKK